jgi:hypothetical protein
MVRSGSPVHGVSYFLLEETEPVEPLMGEFNKILQVSDAQNLVRKKIVSPYLDDVISEQSLSEDPQGLKGLLQRVSKIILDLLVCKSVQQVKSRYSEF